MPGKAISPEVVTVAIALRTAGFSVAVIASRVRVSVRTLSRVFDRYRTRKGTVKQELIDAAKRDIIESVMSIDGVKQEIARIVADDIAHARLLRERVAEAYHLLAPTNLEEAALCMRAAAAAATCLRVTSAMMRTSLRADKALDHEDAAEIGELTITEVTADEALRMRKSNADALDLPSPALPSADSSDADIDVDDQRAPKANMKREASDDVA